MSDSLQIETAIPASSVASSRPSPSPVNGLTTFPNPFVDEPEQGILPALFSKVKSTFGSSTNAVPPSKSADKGTPSTHELPTTSVLAQTEAQQIVEAVKNRTHGTLQSRRQSGPGSAPVSILAPLASAPLPGDREATTSPTSRSRPTRSGRPIISNPPSANSVSTHAHPPSVASSSSRSQSQSQTLAPPKRFFPAERKWGPTGVSLAQTQVSPVTSVTVTTITGTKPTEEGSMTNASGPSRPMHHAHFGLQAAVAPARPAHQKHSHSNSVGGLRLRRSSISTLPDSPSSISLSAMIAANAELSQNFSYVPGFPLAQDDVRSVRSLGFNKKTGSVSKIIRRMRGEGLSKHYWMADEHCKECYDCKSVFSAWRRKHHCRICGQIFCSRCASNIIGARRFGRDGMVRVCDLCLKIMEEYKDDDDDDRRSINSVSTSVRLPSISDRAFLEAGRSPETSYVKSPFAASQLFTRHPNESLSAIDEGAVPMRWGGTSEQDFDRPYTPNDLGGSQTSDGEDGHIWTARPTAAPFRRALEEEAKNGKVDEDPPVNDDTGPSSVESPSPARNQPTKKGEMLPPPVPRFKFPRVDTATTDFTDPRVALGQVDINAPLIGLRTRLSSRASQGGLTSLLDSEKTEGLWRARSHSQSLIQRPELISGASLNHFHLMLQQAIARADLPHSEEWHRVLSKLLLKVSTNLQPNVRAGDSIDVRAYVKIKKIPGGKISDSEYVDGIVITKNVAHKAMPRRLVNPRIMVVTFPLDYHRIENQFMSLDPILAQERDYLRRLTKRIIDVRPHIVLVERSASRIALEYLLEANIAVARSVKPSAIHQVARCTQADVVASMDRLALEPRLGRCAEFQIQSFEHDLIPGRRKTFMRFEGCHRDYGCTILLRGGDLETLKKVKVITDFMALIIYHLKLEIFLYNDEHNILPPQPQLSAQYQDLRRSLWAKIPKVNNSLIQGEGGNTDSQPDSPGTPHPHDDRLIERREAVIRTKEIAQSLEPYLSTVLSASVAVRFPPPAPLAKMAHLDSLLTTLRRNRDDEEAAQILHEETKGVDAIRSPEVDLSSAPITPSSSELSEKADVSSTTAMSALPISSLSKESTRDPYRVLRKPEEIAKESAITQIAHEHAEQVKLWQWYTRRHSSVLRPDDYQGIVYLYSLGTEGTEKPCVEPQLQHLNFYQPDDHTVGQFLENLAIDAAKPCPNKSCERIQLFHFRLLVHGERRLQIAMDQFPCPSPGHEDKIITWSYCRLCAMPSPTTILREETWKMSWGTYLEHCFYPPSTRAGFQCSHDAYRDQIRYFAHRNLAIRIHNEQIELFEPVRPSISLQIKAETKVILKNQEYESALHKNAAFFDSVLFRLRSFDYEIVQPDKVSLLRTALENMLSRAVADREELVNLLNRTYKLTPMTDVLALNTVLRTLQDKVVQWDLDFADIEKAFMPSEKDLRRMTATHLKRLFANQDVFNSLDRSVAGLTVSEADEKDGDKTEKLSILETPGPSEPATPAFSPTSDAGVSPLPHLDLETPNVEDDGITPTVAPRADPFSTSPGYDSDSTISAIRRDSPERQRSPETMDRLDSSGMDSDIHGFVSRLPRRSRPAPSIADLVKRFQESVSNQHFSPPTEGPSERPRSSMSMRRAAARSHSADGSDSDNQHVPRPRLRRGKTEQPPSHRRDNHKPGLYSDGDRSYAANASRIASGRQSFGGRLDQPRPPSRPKTPATAAPLSSGRNSPDPSARLLAPVPNKTVTALALDKPRMTGKGKMPRRSETPSGRSSPLIRGTPRRSVGGSGNRVSSIARHFDRLSREAERDRQKRISLARGKRARPVGVTKAKVQVFDNLRDAFKDEFDTDSSEADNEEDDDNDGDSADSAGRPRHGRKSSSPTKERVSSQPIPVPVEEGAPSSAHDEIPVSASASASSIAGTSILSEANTDVSFTDRLQIELPPFDTCAPLPSVPVTPQLSADTADEGRHPLSQMSQMSESELSSGGERSSILKTLSGLWAFRAGEFSPLEYPLSAAEHLFADSRVIIRETEPTSIIAFTLSSKTYRDKMRNVLFHQKAGRKVETFMPEDGGGDRSSAWDIVSLDEAVETDDASKREGGTHLKYDFESGASTIFCRIFFAEQFAALRSACQCEDSFVESLARCIQFDAAGGKSGSAFLKTKDDRFIAKEISRLEMDALTKFAPAYFEYTRKGLQGQRPSVLAKIYGFFKIGYRNATTGRVMRMNVLVMENLFYERRFSKIYDLKGSMRNRLIQPTGRVNEVLLDENLMEIVYKHPLYLRDHAKRILRTALFNDTLFLSNLNVMDYSLVVGVDSEKHELVVGIVDYIRTFTWDKKLESWVKDSAFLGGAGKGEPTIVTPKQYKTRFRTAMERFYFPSVPDRWTKVGAEDAPVEEENATMA
ncbi:hypothetical protein P7C73_g3088, partial [Tremellales sp. Uapishka_1]